MRNDLIGCVNHDVAEVIFTRQEKLCLSEHSHARRRHERGREEALEPFPHLHREFCRAELRLRRLRLRPLPLYQLVPRL